MPRRLSSLPGRGRPSSSAWPGFLCDTWAWLVSVGIGSFSVILISSRSTQFRRDGFDGFNEPLVKFRIHGTMLNDHACRIRAEMVAAFPVVCRPDRAGRKSAAALRANIVQGGVDARTAKGAFKRTNHCVRGVGWKRRVAVLAGGS